jgi:hypothetical protein
MYLRASFRVRSSLTVLQRWAVVSAPSSAFFARAVGAPSQCGFALLNLRREREFGKSCSFCDRKGYITPSWGSFGGGATRSFSSLWSRTAAPDRRFHCHHRSSNGRCSFIVSSSA